MFIENKYKIIYFRIIDNAKERKISGYIEKHHVIPKCIGGLDDISNIVELTAREHYICHRLLTKITTGEIKRKMLFALGRFMQDGSNTKRNLNSRQYEICRLSVSIARTGLKRSDETKSKISNSLKGNIPWNKGKKGLQKMSDETKNALSVMYSGKTYEERYNKEKAIEIKEKISSSKMGKPPGMAGKTHSEETKIKMSESMKKPKGPQKRHPCPHCGEREKTARHIKYCKINYKE